MGGARRRNHEVCLASEKRGHLHDVGDIGYGVSLALSMQVGTDRHTKLRFDCRQNFKTPLQARSPIAVN